MGREQKPASARFRAATADHARVLAETVAACEADFMVMLNIWTRTIRAGGKILFFGNGGSAADAQHLAAELTGRFVKDRAPLAGLALTTDSSALTAIGNDYGFDAVFERQVRALGQAGDSVVGISTSGDSPNVLAALRAAREKGLSVTGLAGRTGGAMASICDACVIVPVDSTARIQEMHIMLGHLLIEGLEAELGLS